jgi:hypothetical protein
MQAEGFPPTAVLTDAAVCEDFYHRNHLWAPEGGLWFVKDSHGSLGIFVYLYIEKKSS